MSPGAGTTALWVRVARRTAALERVLRLLRSLLHGPPEISLSRGPEGAHELRVDLPGSVARPAQVRRELLSLHDVLDVVELAGEGALPGRELALVRLRDPGGEPPEEAVAGRSGEVRVVHADGGHLTVEVTGTAPEVERVLARWLDDDRIVDATRTGEIVLPGAAPAGVPAGR